MASVSVFNTTRFTALAAVDVIGMVHVADVTQSAHGSFDSITVTNFFGSVPSPIVQATGTVTVSTPVYSATQTWNAAGVTFTGIKLNITDTASVGRSSGVIGSLLAQYQMGGVNKLLVTKDGIVFTGGVEVAYTSLAAGNPTNGIVAAGTLTAVAATGTGITGTLNLVSVGNTFASPAALGNGASIGVINFAGTKAATGAPVNSAVIAALATEAWGASAAGSRLVFNTTPNGSTTNIPSLTLDQDGSGTFAFGLTVAGKAAVGGATISTTTALITGVGTTGVSSLRVPHGVAPTSPVNGDKWTTTAGEFVQINGSTANLIWGSVLASLVTGATVGISSTTYSTNGTGALSATELLRQMPMPLATVVRNLRFVTSGAQGAGGSLVVTVRKNGADTALTITVTAGAAAGTFTDTTHSVAFAVGDLFSVGIVNNDAAAVSATIAGFSCVAQPI